MRSILLLATTLGALSCTATPGPVRSPPFARASSCADAAHHRLDFWLGEWDVVGPTGAPEGTNVISRAMGGCAIEERWTDAHGGSGRSLFFFDGAEARWKQVWVTSEGGWKEKRERDGAPPGSVRFEGEVPRPAGGTARDRTTLTPLADGRVRQVIEQSIDGGATWARWEGVYVRAKPVPACADASHRAFDFWVGDWDLVVRTRRSAESEEWTEAVGTNEIRATHRGCVVEEHFAAGPPEAPWAGHSISTFTDGQWRQTWVDDQGSYLPFVGAWTGSEMILRGVPAERGGKRVEMRMVFTAITKSSLLRRWERTEDGGASWRVMMTIAYRRR